MKNSAILFLVISLTPLTFAQTKSKEARTWEHEHSDIPVNSRIHFGKLENGLRYAWLTNSEPNKRCYIRLHVNVGSLAETESEQGVAHFLEHMAFNGTKHLPGDSAIEWFQKHGMAFGADTNAHTSFSETVYKLDLPNSDEKTISEGFEYFRDVADGLLLDEKEVQAEKGVVDGEDTSADSPGYRVWQKQMASEYKGSRVAARLPIGIKAVRDKFDAKSVRAFYEKWYRPENMTLVIVGDLKALNPETLIKKYFAEIKAPTTNPDSEPALGKPAPEGNVFSFYEKEIPTVTISVETFKLWQEEPATVANWTKRLALNFANSMLNLRFYELAKKENAPFLSASVNYSSDGLRVFEGEGLAINCTPEKWKEAVAACEQEVRRAVEFGFQDSELSEVRANYLRGLDEAVEKEKTRSSQAFLGEILDAAEERSVPTDAETARKIFKPLVEALTLEQCHKDFAKAWKEGNFFMDAYGNLDLGKDGEKMLKEVYDNSRKVKVEPKTKEESKTFPYASSADKAGKIKSRKHIEDLDIDQLEFENGVRMNIKKTDFKEKEIVVSLRLGEGALAIEPSKIAVALVAQQTIQQCGLGKLSQDELRRVTAGKQITTGIYVDQDRFILDGQTNREDLLLQCEIISAYLTDPGWRQEGLTPFMKSVGPWYEGLDHSLEGPMYFKFFPSIYPNPHLGTTIPPRAEVEAVNMEALKAWIAPQLKEAAIEVTFVGDLDIEETIKIGARVFGALPARKALQKHEERKKPVAIAAGIKKTEEVDTKIPKSLVLTVFPASDGIDAARRRNLFFLGQVLNDRVRIEVREKLGASYSPGAWSQLSTVFPGEGMFMMQAISDVDKVNTVVEAFYKVASDLEKDGITQEELDRLREPVSAQLRDQQRRNRFWVNVLFESQAKPYVLDDQRVLLDHYKNMKKEDLSALAKAYFKKDKASVLVVNPKKAAEEKKEEPAKSEK